MVLTWLCSYLRQDSRFHSIHTFSRKCFYSNRTPAFLIIQMDNIEVSVICLAPSIYEAENLDGWAVTLSLKDGCFWAYLPTVSGSRHSSYTLNIFLGTLTPISVFPVSDWNLTPQPWVLLQVTNKFLVRKYSVGKILCKSNLYFTLLVNATSLY